MAIPENSDATVCLSNIVCFILYYETVILSKECVRARRGEKDPLEAAPNGLNTPLPLPRSLRSYGILRPSAYASASLRMTFLRKGTLRCQLVSPALCHDGHSPDP